MCLYIEFQLFRLRNDQDIHCPKNASLCVHYNCVNYTYPFIALLSMLFNKPLRLLRNRTFSTKSQELAIIGEYQLPEWAADIPSHAQVAKFSLIIVGWWRLRISDGKFVKHTTEMILWSMILTSVHDRQPTHKSLTFFHKLILFSKLEHSCVWLWTW